MNNKLKDWYFSCECKTDEHTLRFTFDPDLDVDGVPDFPELWSSVFLSDTAWYKRVWSAVRYVFGYKCRYGHFGNWTIDPDDIQRLKDMIRDYEEAYKQSNRVVKYEQK